MREKGIGVEREKGVIVGNEAQTIAELKERVLLSEWQRQIVSLKEITDRCFHTPTAASVESKIEISCGKVKVAFKGSVEKELLQVVLGALRSC